MFAVPANKYDYVHHFNFTHPTTIAHALLAKKATIEGFSNVVKGILSKLDAQMATINHLDSNERAKYDQLSSSYRYYSDRMFAILNATGAVAKVSLENSKTYLKKNS